MIKETDRIYAFRVMQMLLKPFKEQKAFELGLIDSNGNHLKNPEPDQEQYYTKLHQVAFAVKQIMDSLPSGEYRLRKFATAMNLLRPTAIPSIYQEDVQEKYLKTLKMVMETNLRFMEEEMMVGIVESEMVPFDDFISEGNLFTVQTDHSMFNIMAPSLKEAQGIVSRCLGISEDMVTSAAIDSTTPRIKKNVSNPTS
jgi:hypothetical protein